LQRQQLIVEHLEQDAAATSSAGEQVEDAAGKSSPTSTFVRVSI
jgi:hypothetical protein